MKVRTFLGSVFTIALLYGGGVGTNSTAATASSKDLAPAPHLASNAAPAAISSRTIYTGIIAAPLSLSNIRAPASREQTLLARTKDWTDIKIGSKSPPPNAVVLPQLESLAQSFVEPISRYTVSALPVEIAADDARKSRSVSSATTRDRDGEQNVSLGFSENAFLGTAVDTRFSQTAGR